MKEAYSIRQSIARIFFWIVLFCFANSVIDSPTAWRIKSVQRADMLTNEFDSIYEWVLEAVIDLENAVPEHENQKTEDNTHKLKSDWDDHSHFLVMRKQFSARRASCQFYTETIFDLSFSVPTPPPDLLS